MEESGTAQTREEAAGEQRRLEQMIMRHPFSRWYLWNRDEGICKLCGVPVPYEKMVLDHITPGSLGGATTFDNLQVAHRSCNSRKCNGQKRIGYTKEQRARNAEYWPIRRASEQAATME